MNESNSLEATDKTILSEQIKFRLSEIIRIENYLYQSLNLLIKENHAVEN